MSFLIHLVLTVIILYCVISYLTCGYICFFPKGNELKESNFGIRLLFWFLAPFVILDFLCNKVFGRGFMS